MKKKTLTAREVRESRFLVRAPLFAVPLLTVLFWAFGGGKGLGSKGLAHGFMMRVPDPHVVPVTKLDKMGYYEQAKKDSAAARQREKMEDNYARRLGLGVEPMVRQVEEKLGELKMVMAGGAGGGKVAAPAVAGGASDFAARFMAHAAAGGRSDVGRGLIARAVAPSSDAGPVVARTSGPDLNRLERMLGAFQQNEGSNPEIAQLSAVLDKLIEVQKPREDSGLIKKAAVMVKPVLMAVWAVPDVEDTFPGFDSSSFGAIVPEEQVFAGSGELRMELVKDIVVGGHFVPAGSEVYGLATLNGERLRVVVNSIATQGKVFQVNFMVIDQDGLPGIHIPGAPMADAVRASAGSELGAIGPTPLTTNLAGQAANAGVTLARSLIGKKLRPVKVTVPAGYQVVLHVQNQGL